MAECICGADGDPCADCHPSAHTHSHRIADGRSVTITDPDSCPYCYPFGNPDASATVPASDNDADGQPERRSDGRD